MQLEIFKNVEFGEVRALQIDGEPWFVGKDVSDALGYEKSRNALSAHVEEDDALKWGITDSLGRTQETTIINESGLYSLVMGSKLPSAKKFKRWVTSDVLPSIRKHGLYAMDKLLDNPDMLISALNKLKEERQKVEALTLNNSVKDQQIAELQPKATYYDLVLQCKDLISVTQISKDYGMSAMKFNDKLHQLGIQFKMRDTWLLYQKHADKGYTSTKTVSYVRGDGSIGSGVHTYWTQSGRLFLYDQLKKAGIIPKLER